MLAHLLTQTLQCNQTCINSVPYNKDPLRDQINKYKGLLHKAAYGLLALWPYITLCNHMALSVFITCFVSSCFFVIGSKIDTLNFQHVVLLMSVVLCCC